MAILRMWKLNFLSPNFDPLITIVVTITALELSRAVFCVRYNKIKA